MWTTKNRGVTTAAGCDTRAISLTMSGAAAPLIPPAKRGGNRRHVDVREVMNGSCMF